MPRTDLPNAGTLTLAGYSFATTISTSISVEPVNHSDNFEVLYYRHTLNVTAVLTAENFTGSNASVIGITALNPKDPVDTGIIALRRKLLKTGISVQHSGLGFGSITSTKNSDPTVFGPQCTFFDWKPIGGKYAALVALTVVFHTSPCDTDFSLGIYYSASVANNVSFSEYGLPTVSRTYSLMFPLYSSNIITTATLFKVFRIPRVMPGYRRAVTYDMPENRVSASINVLDTYIDSPSPYPPGIIDARLNYTVGSNTEDSGFARWDCFLTGYLQGAPGVSKSHLAQTAGFLITDRLRESRSGSYGDIIIFTSILFSDAVFERTVEFSLAWTFATTIEKIFSGTGIWRPVQGVTWDGWAASMESFGYGTTPGLTTVVDLGDTARLIAPISGSNFCTPSGNLTQLEGLQSRWVEQAFSIPNPLLGTPRTSETHSWLSYDMRLAWDARYQTFNVTYINPAISGETGKSDFRAHDGGGTSLQESANQALSTTRRGNPYHQLIAFVGVARRVGKHIPIPNVSSVNGKTAVLMHKGIRASNVVAHTADGLAIYEARWTLVYWVPSTDAEATITLENVPTFAEDRLKQERE